MTDPYWGCYARAIALFSESKTDQEAFEVLKGEFDGDLLDETIREAMSQAKEDDE